MKLAELLEKNNKSIDGITKIYHGKNRWCRCGCGGKYFEKGEKGFTRALNELQKDSFVPGDYEEIDVQNVYVNIPQGYEEENRCYCLYFN